MFKARWSGTTNRVAFFGDALIKMRAYFNTRLFSFVTVIFDNVVLQCGASARDKSEKSRPNQIEEGSYGLPYIPCSKTSLHSPNFSPRNCFLSSKPLKSSYILVWFVHISELHKYSKQLFWGLKL